MQPKSAFAIDLPPGVLKRACAGDHAAFEQIYRQFERPIYALALRVLGDAEEAMEVVHDALLKVFRGLAGFRGDAPFWGWLRQIAANEALMRLRRRDRVLFMDELPEAWLEDETLLLPVHAAEHAVLERALAELPATTRAVLWMFHAEGFSHDEIGRLMGRSSSFSKSQLARGTRRLRSLLHVEVEVTSHV